MHGIEHPYSHALYEPDGPSRVRITARDGRSGVYDPVGRWIAGEKLDADPQLCGWIAAPRAVHRMAGTAK